MMSCWKTVLILFSIVAVKVHANEVVAACEDHQLVVWRSVSIDPASGNKEEKYYLSPYKPGQGISTGRYLYATKVRNEVTYSFAGNIRLSVSEKDEHEFFDLTKTDRFNKENIEHCDTLNP